MEGNILLWIQNTLRSPFFNPPLIFITKLGDHALIWIAVLLLLLIFPKTRKSGFICLFSFLLALIVNNLVLKNCIMRIRPYEAVEGLKALVPHLKDSSFPSGHTAISFSVAFVMLLTCRKIMGIPAMILASLIALSRMYVGVHYPSDVLAGLIVGCTTSVISLWIVSLFLKRKNTKEVLQKDGESSDKV